jgi:hypothetical protein
MFWVGPEISDRTGTDVCSDKLAQPQNMRPLKVFEEDGVAAREGL